MAQPSDKAEGIESFLTGVFGVDRRKAIQSNKCIPGPIGCGRAVDPKVVIGFTESDDSQAAMPFRDALSLKEYSISGLCQACQDSTFGAVDSEG